MLSQTNTIPSRWIAVALFASCSLSISLVAQSSPRVVHVFVALADNQHQGIIPVPAALGNGHDPQRNLYWGAAYGVKAFFKASQDWELLNCERAPKGAILERCVFQRRRENVYVIADAYEGSEIQKAITDFLSAAAGVSKERIVVRTNRGTVSLTGANSAELTLDVAGAADIVVYIGHDGLMDFQIAPIAGTKADKPRRAIILACASKAFFEPYVRQTGAEPLVWTTGLMAPEAYTLKAALDGWVENEDDETIRRRAAEAYDKYQKCGARAALRLFTTGW